MVVANLSHRMISPNKKMCLKSIQFSLIIGFVIFVSKCVLLKYGLINLFFWGGS